MVVSTYDEESHLPFREARKAATFPLKVARRELEVFSDNGTRYFGVPNTNFFFRINKEDRNNPKLHPHTLLVSDEHFGDDTRASEIAHMHEHMTADQTVNLGDLFGGIRFSFWQEQALARMLKVLNIVLRGNHDDHFMKDLLHGSIFGVKIADRAYIKDAQSDVLLLIHGDEGDLRLHSEDDPVYVRGGRRYDRLKGVDACAHWITGRDNFSLLGFAKKLPLIKSRIDRHIRETEDQIAKIVDADPIARTVACGHTHWPKIKKTDGGKYYFNVGDRREDNHFGCIDDYGTMASGEWTKKGLVIMAQNGVRRLILWDDLSWALEGGDFKQSPSVLPNHDPHLKAVRLIFRTLSREHRFKDFISGLPAHSPTLARALTI